MMQHASALLLLLTVSLLVGACTGGLVPAPTPTAEEAPAPGTALAITHVTVIDVAEADPSSARRPDQTVLVAGGRVTAVGPADSVALPAGAVVVDGRGRYLIPGLWDAHAHTAYGDERALAAYVANGVTSVRDLGGPLPELLAWRQRIAEGALLGPRLFVAGPNIEGSWWLDRVVELVATDPLLRSFPFLEASPRYRLAGPEGAAAAVDSLLRLGVDVVKFRNLRADEFYALAAAARRRGVPLVGHAPGGVPLSEAAEAGVSSIEHMETVSLKLGDAGEGERRAELVRVARAGTAVTPTLVTDVAYRQTPDSVAYAVIADTLNRVDPRRRFLSEEMLAFWRFGLDTKKFEGPNDWAASHRRQLADLRLAREAGVPILVGTDLGVSLVYPGFGVHEELAYLVEVGGLPPLEALRGATLYPAESIGLAGAVGAVAPGMEADLVLLGADPLRDIRGTREIEAVVLDGRLLDRGALDEVLGVE